MTKILEGKYLVFGGDRGWEEKNIFFIEIEDVKLSALHMVEATGMYTLLGRNMC